MQKITYPMQQKEVLNNVFTISILAIKIATFLAIFGPLYTVKLDDV
jgi:hypothetical protein